MPGSICPSCRADIEDDLVASTGVASCPFCGTELPPEVLHRDAAAGRPEAELPLEDAADVAAGLPRQSKVQLVESSDRRRVFYIPAGGKRTRFIGCFSVAWILFMVVFTVPFVAAGLGDAPLIIIVPFFGLFWAIGLGMFVLWLKMRYTRTFVLLEFDRLVIQRILFGRKSVAETALTTQSRAELVEAYRANNEPVYSVAVVGNNQTAKFGTSLSLDEKNWFVGQINDFLGVSSGDSEPGLPADAAIEPDVPEIDPNAANLHPQIVVLEATSKRLEFQLPLVPGGKVRNAIVAVGLVTTLVWQGVSAASFLGMINWNNPGAIDAILGVFLAILLLSGLIPVLLALFAVSGKITVDLTPDTLTCRWHLGPLGPRKSLPTSSISQVMVANAMVVKRQRQGVSSRSPAGSDFKGSLVIADDTLLPLTTFHGTEVAREVTGLVKHQLRRMGITLPDA